MNDQPQPQNVPHWQDSLPRPAQTQDLTRPEDGGVSEKEKTPPPSPFPALRYQPPVPVRQIPLEAIAPNPRQPRKQFPEDTLRKLADSIRLRGVLQPILLRQRAADRFEIVAGERRFRAAQMAGLMTIPALVREFDDRDQAELSLIENVQREDLSPLATARGLRTLMQEFKMTQKEVGERVGKSQSMISNLLHLLELPEEILESVDSGEIQEGHARLLLRIEDEARQRELWQQIIKERLSVRKAEQQFEGKTKAPAEPAQAESDPYGLAEMNAFAMQELLMQKLESRVLIRQEVIRGGRIEISFHDKAGLIGIVERLLHTSA